MLDIDFKKVLFLYKITYKKRADDKDDSSICILSNGTPQEAFVQATIFATNAGGFYKASDITIEADNAGQSCKPILVF